MKWAWLIAVLIGWSFGQASMMAQSRISAGTILPVSLDKGLGAAHLHDGQVICATVMQSIPDTPVHRGERSSDSFPM